MPPLFKKVTVVIFVTYQVPLVLTMPGGGVIALPVAVELVMQ